MKVSSVQTVACSSVSMQLVVTCGTAGVQIADMPETESATPAATNDLYSVLGVETDASSEDLKKAYDARKGKASALQDCTAPQAHCAHASLAGCSRPSATRAGMQGGVLEQQQVEGAWDILGKEASRKAYDKDAKDQAASAKVSAEAKDSDSTAEVALSGLATADTGHLSLDDLKDSAAKVCHQGAPHAWSWLWGPVQSPFELWQATDQH